MSEIDIVTTIEIPKFKPEVFIQCNHCSTKISYVGPDLKRFTLNKDKIIEKCEIETIGGNYYCKPCIDAIRSHLNLKDNPPELGKKKKWWKIL